MSKGLCVSVDGWLAASLDVTVGAFNDVWTPAEDINALIDVQVELEAWLNDGARPWAATFAVTVFETLSPWLGLRVDASAATTYAPDTELQALLDWPAAGQGAAYIHTQTGVRHTVDCKTDIAAWIPLVRGSGGITRSGSYMRDSQVYATRKPQAEALMNEAQTAALGEALELSSVDRWVWLWRPSVDEWVKLYVGRVDTSRAQMPIYRATIEAIG